MDPNLSRKKFQDRENVNRIHGPEVDTYLLTENLRRFLLEIESVKLNDYLDSDSKRVKSGSHVKSFSVKTQDYN